VRYTAYQRIYERFSFLTLPRAQNGRILRHSRAMSGSAGLSPSKNRKPEGSTLSAYARNLKKECAGLVAGQAAFTAEIRDGVLVFDFIFPPLQRTGSSLSIPKSGTSAQEAGALASHVVPSLISVSVMDLVLRRLRTVGSTPTRFRHIHFASNGLCGSQVGTSGQ
jgi:hypothetical protein